jgi:hypothetical protein
VGLLGKDGRVLRDVTSDDFISGLLAALVRRDVKAVSTRTEAFYQAVEASFQTFAKAVSEAALDLELDFTVYLDPLYEDSPVIREAISAAVQRNLISLDNPEYVDMRMKFGRVEASDLLNHLPGEPGWYDDAAKAFLDAGPSVAA